MFDIENEGHGHGEEHRDLRHLIPCRYYFQNFSLGTYVYAKDNAHTYTHTYTYTHTQRETGVMTVDKIYSYENHGKYGNFISYFILISIIL